MIDSKVETYIMNAFVGVSVMGTAFSVCIPSLVWSFCIRIYRTIASYVAVCQPAPLYKHRWMSVLDFYHKRLFCFTCIRLTNTFEVKLAHLFVATSGSV